MPKIQLTHDQKAAHFETYEHIHEVQKLINKVVAELLQRSNLHDLDKIYHSEHSAKFAESTKNLKNNEYGSDGYKKCMVEIESAIKHHYQNNSHHPESHQNGINDMNLIDLFEMLCDWKASTLRTKDGDIYKSLEIQKCRFNIDDQLLMILKNTVKFLEEK